MDGGKEVELNVDLIATTSRNKDNDDDDDDSDEAGGEEEEEEEGDDEDDDAEETEIVKTRKLLNINKEKNAQMMIAKHDHKKNKSTIEFNVGDNITVKIPRIDRAGTAFPRLPGKVF